MSNVDELHQTYIQQQSSRFSIFPDNPQIRKHRFFITLK